MIVDVKEYALDTQTKAFLNDGEKWFRTLDRSCLGDFAVDAQLLITLFAYEAVHHMGYHTLFKHATRIQDLMIGRNIQLNRNPFVWDDVISELMFWWKQDKVPLSWRDKYRDYADATSFDSKQGLTFLDFVVDFTSEVPAAMPYLEAGISDRIVIERFINDGIDPNIAVTLNRNVA